MLITFEGTEGVGKSTQLVKLEQKLVQRGYQVVSIREPGGTPFGEQCRAIFKHTVEPIFPETELLLLNASRAQLVRQVIRPALAVGKVVLCDRYIYSTIAYQQFGRRLDGQLVSTVIKCAIGDTHPDLTILLVASEAVTRNRIASRKKTDRIEAEDAAFFQRVDEGLMCLAEKCPDIQVVGADGSVDDVAEQVWRHVAVAIKACG